MEVQNVHIIPHNQEENGIDQQYKENMINAVGAALKTQKMNWEHWPWEMVNANDKYNQLPHSGTGR